MHETWDALWINATLMTVTASEVLTNAGIAVSNGKIVWLGPMATLSPAHLKQAKKIHDMQGVLITPGFIDCHTHLVFAGNRAQEFALRLQGMSYEEIAKAGGGIASTVQATRAAAYETLLQESLPRAKALMQSGVTTIEIKSGYGLDLATEIKMLRVAEAIEKELSITIKRTFLGAHVVPNEYKNTPEKYVDLICHDMIPNISKEKLAESVDVFCEKIAFNYAQTEKIFKTAKEHGLQIKCHAEQLSDSNSAALAAKYDALSCDHLEYISEKSVTAMKKNGTVAVLLPGAFYCLREKKLPPVSLLRDADISIAIASDCNPGTSPICSLPIVMNMAATLFGLTPEEILAGVTINAAKALGISKTHGSLAVEKQADFAIWQTTNPVDIIYYMGQNFLHQLVKNGEIIYEASF